MENIHQVTERLMAGANVVVVPTVWHKTVLKNDKPYFPAMWMLAHIISKYETHPIQIANADLSEELGLTYKQVKDAKKVLTDLGIIRIELRVVQEDDGTITGNNSFIELLVEGVLQSIQEGL